MKSHLTHSGQVLVPAEPDHFCDTCSVKRDPTVVCDGCGGFFCANCVSYRPRVAGENVGKFLCHRCDGVVGAIEHQRRMGRERT